MMVKVRHRAFGRHVHVRVFTAREPDQTYALTGQLVFRDEEWETLRSCVVTIGAAADGEPPIRFVFEEER